MLYLFDANFAYYVDMCWCCLCLLRGHRIVSRHSSDSGVACCTALQSAVSLPANPPQSCQASTHLDTHSLIQPCPTPTCSVSRRAREACFRLSTQH